MTGRVRAQLGRPERHPVLPRARAARPRPPRSRRAGRRARAAAAPRRATRASAPGPVRDAGPPRRARAAAARAAAARARAPPARRSAARRAPRRPTRPPRAPGSPAAPRRARPPGARPSSYTTPGCETSTLAPRRSHLHPRCPRRGRPRQGGPGRAALAGEGGVGLQRVVARGGESPASSSAWAASRRASARSEPMPAASSSVDRGRGVGACLGRQPRGQQDVAAVHQQQRERHALLAVLGLDAVVPLQRRGDVAAAGGDPAEVVADLGRGERLADRLVQPLGAQQVGLGGAQRAEVHLQHAAVAQQARLPQHVAGAAQRGQGARGSPSSASSKPPELLQDRRPLREHPRARSCPSKDRQARARPRPAPRDVALLASAPGQAHAGLAGPALQAAVHRQTPPPAADASTAAPASPSSIAASPSARSAAERASTSEAEESTERASERAARASAEARRTASSACSSTVTMVVTLPQPTLARHPADRRRSQHERTARALGPTQGRRQPRQRERLPAAPRPAAGRPGRREGRAGRAHRLEGPGQADTSA